MKERQFVVNKISRRSSGKAYGDAVVTGYERKKGTRTPLCGHLIHVSTESIGRCHYDLAQALISRNVSTIIGLHKKLQEFYDDQ